METQDKPAAGAAAPAPFVPAAKREITLNPQRMQLAEYQRNDWVVTAEQGTVPEDLINPAYFAHMAAQLKPYDHIEVRIDDNSWLAALVVLEVDRNWARVKITSFTSLVEGDDNIERASKAHSVEFKGPHFKWSVIRLSDGDKIKTGCSSRAEANAWLTEFEKVA